MKQLPFTVNVEDEEAFDPSPQQTVDTLPPCPFCGGPLARRNAENTMMWEHMTPEAQAANYDIPRPVLCFHCDLSSGAWNPRYVGWWSSIPGSTSFTFTRST
jgi:hypothetical protein